MEQVQKDFSTMFPGFNVATRRWGKQASIAQPRALRIAAPAETRKKVELYTTDFYTKCAMGGALSCGLTHTLVVPLDLVKCRLQVSKEYSGILDGFKKIGKTEGFAGLRLGWVPTLFGYSAQGLCKFGFYEYFKKKYADAAGEKNAERFKDLLYLSASASAEVIADAALCPFESVKVRIQTQPGYARTFLEAAPKMYAEEGLNAFYKGLVPLWLRQVPYTMMKFWAFERTVAAIYKHALSKPKEEYNKAQQLGVSFAGGYIAGVFCAIVSHPADTVVSKLNQGKGATIGQILKDVGPVGIWRGLTARIIMIGTLTALQWFIYDSFKVYVGLPTTGAKKEEPKAVTGAPSH